MKTLVRISNALASKALGSVDAGACESLRGCCCNTAHTRGYDCYLNCVNNPQCTTVYSAYHVKCGNIG